MSLFKGRSKIDKSDLLFSRRDLLKIIIPVFFQQILAMTVGMINTMMVSNAGDAAVAGVSLVVTLDNVLIVFFTALVTGGSVIVAQRLGTSNTKDISEAAKQLMYATTIVATAVMATVLIFRVPLLKLFLPTDELAVRFAEVRMFSLFTLFWMAAINGILSSSIQAFGYPTFPMLNSIVTVLIFRIIWMNFIYTNLPTTSDPVSNIFNLYSCYMVSWTLSLITCTVMFFVLYYRYKRGKVKSL